MSASPGILRRSFDMVAVFALLNFAGLAALIGYFVATGALDGATLRAIGQVISGAETVEKSDVTSSDEPQESVIPAGDPAKHTSSHLDRGQPQSEVQMELVQREAERIRVELDQRLNLINSVLLRVENERKTLEEERERAKQADKEEREARKDVGFEKQVAIFDSLAPKIAVQHLLSMTDPKEAARILLELDTDKAQKIVEAARRGEDLARMQGILQHLRTVAPAKSQELESPEP